MRASLPVLPCVHFEGEVPPPAHKRPTAKTFIRCAAGMGDPPGVQCLCHCNPDCPKYVKDDPDAA